MHRAKGGIARFHFVSTELSLRPDEPPATARMFPLSDRTGRRIQRLRAVNLSLCFGKPVQLSRAFAYQ